MKKELGVIPAIFPMPVLMIATYDENGVVDVMNAAWGQACDMDKIALFLGHDRKTLANIRLNKAFTVALADEAHMAQADFFGIASGNRMPDKFARSGLTAVPSQKVKAPIIEEFPLVMECQLAEITETENLFAVVGTIVNVLAEENTLDEKGKVDPLKLNAILFDQLRNGYYRIGGKAGQAWNAGAALMKGKNA